MALSSQERIITTLSSHFIDVVPDSEYGGLCVMAGGEGVNQHCKIISQLNGVTTIDIVNSDLDDLGLRHLATLCTVCRFVYTPGRVTSTGLAFFSRSNPLRCINIQGVKCGGIVDAIAQSDGVADLTLIDCGIDDPQLSFINRLSVLESLCLCRNPIECVDDYFSGCSNLRMIDISGTNVSKQGIAFLRSSGLGNLYASHTSLDDEAVEACGDVRFLERLGLSYTKVSESGASPLVRCRLLKYLSWPASSVTARTIKSFSQMNELRELVLSGTAPLESSTVALLKKQLSHVHVDIPIRRLRNR